MLFKKIALVCLSLAATLPILSACRPQPHSKQPPHSPSAANGEMPATRPAATQAISGQIWDEAREICQPVQQSAADLKLSIQSMLASPNTQTLQRARQSWKDALLSYGKLYFITTMATELPETFPTLKKLHWRIAAYPVQPGYLDAFGPYLYSGLVNDIAINLSSTSLTKQHGLTDDSDIVLGLYALEFMLFGENDKRSANDFKTAETLNAAQKEAGFQAIEETPHFRRRSLVRSQASLLSSDVMELCDLLNAYATTNAPHWRNLTSEQRFENAKKILRSALANVLAIVRLPIEAPVSQESPSPNDADHVAHDVDYYSNTLAITERAQLLANYLNSLQALQSELDSVPDAFKQINTAAEAMTHFVQESQEKPFPASRAIPAIERAINALQPVATGGQDDGV